MKYYKCKIPVTDASGNNIWYYYRKDSFGPWYCCFDNGWVELNYDMQKEDLKEISEKQIFIELL